MILFWVICGVLILIALAFILPPALKRADETNLKLEDERKQANIAIYRDQLSELEADLHNGIVSQEQYPQDRDEIERRLLKTPLEASQKARTAKTAGARGTAYLLGI